MYVSIESTLPCVGIHPGGGSTYCVVERSRAAGEDESLLVLSECVGGGEMSKRYYNVLFFWLLLFGD